MSTDETVVETSSSEETELLGRELARDLAGLKAAEPTGHDSGGLFGLLKGRR